MASCGTPPVPDPRSRHEVQRAIQAHPRRHGRSSRPDSTTGAQLQRLRGAVRPLDQVRVLATHDLSSARLPCVAPSLNTSGTITPSARTRASATSAPSPRAQARSSARSAWADCSSTTAGPPETGRSVLTSSRTVEELCLHVAGFRGSPSRGRNQSCGNDASPCSGADWWSAQFLETTGSLRSRRGARSSPSGLALRHGRIVGHYGSECTPGAKHPDLPGGAT